jgi:uncharacterized protein
MLYVVFFTDNPEHNDARQRKMPDHLDFLERNRDRIRAAGPLRDVTDGAAAGGLWIVEAESPEAVALLYRTDPFWPTGLRRSVRVCEWLQVFAEGGRAI